MAILHRNKEPKIDYRSFPTYESYLLYLEASAIRQQAEKELDSLGGTYKKRYFQLRDKNQLNSASLKEYQDFNKLIKKIKENPEEVRIVIDSKLPDENATKEVDRILASNSDWEVWRVVTYNKAHELMKNSNCGWCIAGYYHNNNTDKYFNDYLNDKSKGLDGGYYFYINKDDKDKSLCILRDTNNNIQVWACPDHRMRDEDLPDNLPKVTGINLDAYEYSGSDGYDGYYDDEEGEGDGRSLEDIISDDANDELEDYIDNYYGGYDRDVWIGCYDLAKENNASNCLNYLLENDDDNVLIERASVDIWDAFWNDDTNLFNALKYALGDDFISDELPYQIRLDRDDSENEKLIELLDDEIGITEDFKTEDGDDYLPQIIAHFDSIDSKSIGWFKKALSDENINEEDSEGELLLERAIEKGHFKLANILLNGDYEIDFDKYEDKHKDLLKEIIDKCEEDNDAISTLNLYNHKLKGEDKDIEDYISDNEKKILLNLAKDGKLKSGEDTLKDIVLDDFRTALRHGENVYPYIKPLNKLGLLNKDIIKEIVDAQSGLPTSIVSYLIDLNRFDLLPEDIDLFTTLSIQEIEKLLSSGKYKFDASKNLRTYYYYIPDLLGEFLKLDSNKANYRDMISSALKSINIYTLCELISACAKYDIPFSEDQLDIVVNKLDNILYTNAFQALYDEAKDTSLFKLISKKYKEKYGEDLVPKD